MRVQVHSPEVSALAPRFLSGYRNPFANPELEKARQDISRWTTVANGEGLGFEAGDEPVVFAGFEFSNDETGGGAVVLQPKMLIRVCRNGLTLPAFAVKKVHLGVKLEQGIQWNAEVQHKTLEVLTAQAKQAVATWLSPEFLAERVEEIEVASGAPVADAEKTFKVLGKRLGFTEAERSGILSHFIAGAQLTSGGVANAITSYSQTVADAERAEALDSMAISAMMSLAK
jgi:hypothetical protein